MIEAPQNRVVLSEIAPDLLPKFQSGDTDRYIETTSVPHKERYFLEGPRSRSSEFLMTLHIVRDFLRGFAYSTLLGHAFELFSNQGSR